MDNAASWKAKSDSVVYDEMYQRLTDAAWELARFKGLGRLTLNGVAQQAGCARSSVYRYFDNKEQLLGAVLQQRILLLAAQMQETLGVYTDPREQIVQGLYFAVKEVRTGPSLELLATLLVEEGQAVADILVDYVAETATDMLSIDPVFQRGRAAGMVRPDISDEDILRWLVTIALSMFQQSNMEKNPEKELAFLRKMLIPSIFVDPVA